ncbi:MAG TPA: BTAD domain-containing putative transcriptional regulator [Gemmatimonadaceae bacterium]|nr:BTAD domain-containing putative transcriptional regulator [Gemmatimonadaceae bacterium]
MSPQWRLRTLGGASILRDGVVLTGAAAQRRRLALLAVVAAAGDSGISRDRVMALLWPESSGDGARQSLNQLLFLVRRDLQNSDFLSGSAELRMNADVITADVTDLERAARAGHDDAVARLYGGPFLDGFHLREAPEFERWQEGQRARLAKLYFESLHRLATRESAAGNVTAALEYWRRLAAMEPLNGALAASIAQALAALGDTAGALRQLKTHETLLASELGVPPDAALLALEKELRRRISDPNRREREEPPPLVRTDQVTESPPLSAATFSPGRGWVRGLVLGTLTLLLLASGALMISSRRARFDDALIAVAPFEVLDSQLGLWREGMMDILTLDLAGAGPLRSVPSSVVLRQWTGRNDLESAVALGRSTGANLVVLGSLLPSGRDSVRGAVTLVSARTGEILAERETRNGIDHVDALVDSLAVAILRDIGVRRPIRTVRGAALGGANLPALKAFLQGEQLFRHGAMDSAQRLYARAIALDSGFGLAMYRLSWTRYTAPTIFYDSTYSMLAVRAQTLNHGLSRRDSLLILLDSIRVMAEYNPVFEVPRISVGTARRLLRIAQQASGQYEHDAEALYQLGEVYFHFRQLLGTTAHDALTVFDRAIAADSGFSPGYEHVVGLALDQQDTSAARRYLDAALRHAGATDVGRIAPLARELLAGATDRRLAAFLDSLPLKYAVASFETFGGWMDSAETASRIMRYINGRARREEPAAVQFSLFALAFMVARRGHLQEAHTAYVKSGIEEPRLFSELVLLRAVPDSSAARTFAEWLATPDLLRASRAAPWWAVRRDTQSLATLRSRAARRDPSDSLDVGRYVDWSASLYLALARGDTTAALAACTGSADETLPLRFVEDLDCGRLLLARGRNAEAERRLRPADWVGGPLRSVERTRLWAEAAERAGDRASAARGNAFVRAAWRDADWAR